MSIRSKQTAQITGSVRSPCRCPPEELELDVVGVTEGEHGVPGVVGFLDSGVRDFEPVQPLRPFVEVFSAIHQELQVIETRSEFAERFPRMLVVTDKAKNELTMRLKESDVVHAAVLSREVVQHFQVQQL